MTETQTPATAPAAATTPAPAVDPVAERAAFFFDLELAELTAVIPQAEAAEPVWKY